jgi:hypothetical protein
MPAGAFLVVRYTGPVDDDPATVRSIARIRGLIEQLAAINAELAGWAAWEADQHLPVDRQSHSPRPAVDINELRDVVAEIIAQLVELDEHCSGRN